MTNNQPPQEEVVSHFSVRARLSSFSSPPEALVPVSLELECFPFMVTFNPFPFGEAEVSFRAVCEAPRAFLCIPHSCLARSHEKVSAYTSDTMKRPQKKRQWSEQHQRRSCLEDNSENTI
ncbi:unnamed protein product [Pleuronectes platessa]|uniref:Uncharacterized protein n=1 Tax=Pleuronectes platessa TaxID=8262 RepID=A0A9N7URP9_PLEPL|nr:unnamed protein product [Pleuronectes platessa]